jgi:CubicO group peptidase (beta-lactamase class C family)
LIVRNGKLVAEGYCKDKGDRERIHAIQSATKSITSIVAGIAIDKGIIPSVEATIYSFIPQHFDTDPKKREITLYHALTMQTGLAFVNDDHTNELFNCKGSSLEYVLHKGLRFNPGTSFYYNDGDPQLVSGVVQASSGLSLETFANQHLFDPIGIDEYLWESHSDGVNYGAVALWLKPRDMARIGKLMAQNGNWEGQQIVSQTWIGESTAIHANTNYGYYWWNFAWENAFMAIGRGEQIIFVDRDKDVVVVLTTDSFSDSNLSPGIRDLVYGVIAAIID